MATVTTTANSCLLPRHAAAGLTMIIQMNATVCADIDHGEDGQYKIAGSDQRGRIQREREGVSDQHKQENEEAWQLYRFSRRLGSAAVVPNAQA